MRPERVKRVKEVLRDLSKAQKCPMNGTFCGKTRSGSIAPKFGEEEIKITSLIKGWSQE